MKRSTTLALACGLIMGSTAMTFAQGNEAPFRDGNTWCGDPDAVQSAENPYVIQAERNVTRAMKYPDTFWYTWGYAAPESKRRGKADMRELAVTEMDKLAAKLADKPNGYWDILAALYCIRLYRKLPDFPTEKIDGWMTQLRPSVDLNYRINTEENEWMCYAPNTLHQSAAVLQLASVLYQEPKYADMAKACIRKTAQYQEEDGAFRYIRGSGPSQSYYGFDSTFLGCYYQFSRDPQAREMLVRMARYSRDILANGYLESSSSPWWKHHWGTGGPAHGVEIIAGLSRDPLSRAVADKRIPIGQPYFYTYIPMFFWDPTIPRADLPEDICRYNTNIAGPQMRKGDWQVVMPGKGYGDTGIGCTVVTAEKVGVYDGYLEAAALPILNKGVADAYHRPGSAIIVGPEDARNRSSLVGEGWIAAGSVFQPRPPFFGDPLSPPAHGWRVAQVWFADGEGFAGCMTALCDTDTAVLEGPRGYQGVGHPIAVDANVPTRFTTGKLTLQAWGDQVQSLEAVNQEKSRFAWIHFANAGERAYTAGERFGYGLSGCSAGKTPDEVRLLPIKDTILAVQVVRGGTVIATLVFNITQEKQSIAAGALPDGMLSRPGKTPGDTTTRKWAGGRLLLNAYDVVVIR